LPIADRKALDRQLLDFGKERRRKALGSPGATISSKTDEIHKAILNDRCDEAIRLRRSQPKINDLSIFSRLFPAQPCPPGRDSTCDDRLDEARQPSRAGAWPLELR
jgi:hypothetical protein